MKTMNVYFVRDGDGVLLFDAGIKAMTNSIAMAGAELGGITRVVLGHAPRRPPRRRAGPRRAGLLPRRRQGRRRGRRRHPLLGHRATQPARPAAPAARCSSLGRRPGARSPARSPRATTSPASRSSTCPGHAPGQIGLWRESDRLALTSDCFYTLDPQTGAQGPAAPAARRLQPGHRAGARIGPQARRARAGRGLAGPHRPAGRRRQVAAARSRGDDLSCERPWAGDRGGAGRRTAAAAARRCTPSPDGEQQLELRTVLTPKTRAEYARVIGGSPLSQEDAWQRAVEFLFERLAVSWTIHERRDRGPARAAAAAARGDARRAPLRARRARAHCAEWFPDVQAP